VKFDVSSIHDIHCADGRRRHLRRRPGRARPDPVQCQKTHKSQAQKIRTEGKIIMSKTLTAGARYGILLRMLDLWKGNSGGKSS
jgi:hypothetical protein